MKNCVSLIALLCIGIVLGDPLWAGRTGSKNAPEEPQDKPLHRRLAPLEADLGEKENPNRVPLEFLPPELQQEIFLHVLEEFLKRPIDEFEAFSRLRRVNRQTSWIVTYLPAIKERIKDAYLEKWDHEDGSSPQAFCLLYALTKGAQLTSTNHHEEAIQLYCRASEEGSPIAESRLIGLRLAEYCDASEKVDPCAVRLFPKVVPEHFQNIPKKRIRKLCRDSVVLEKLQKTAASFYEEVKEYYESGTESKVGDPCMNRAFSMAFESLIEERQAHFPVVQACLTEKTKWFKRAAKLGHVEFQYRFGNRQKQGNKKKATEWLEKAAAQNHTEALYELAIMYQRGEGIEKDQRRAAKLFEKAAAQGHARSQDSLGNMYFAGEGVDKDRQKATELWEKARAQGVW